MGPMHIKAAKGSAQEIQALHVFTVQTKLRTPSNFPGSKLQQLLRVDVAPTPSPPKEMETKERHKLAGIARLGPIHK